MLRKMKLEILVEYDEGKVSMNEVAEDLVMLRTHLGALTRDRSEKVTVLVQTVDGPPYPVDMEKYICHACGRKGVKL